MQADFSLEDQSTFQQVLPLQQFMTGRRAKREREGGKKAPSRVREGGEGGKKAPSRVREGGVGGKKAHSRVREGGEGGKKAPSRPESEAIATTPFSSKLLHEKVHTCTCTVREAQDCYIQYMEIHVYSTL